ncbi:MAG: hypothetical protein JWQ81_1466 [Amycolatopsis sp.]|nr:hypothetical protein [Amycolatopsis sp.]
MRPVRSAGRIVSVMVLCAMFVPVLPAAATPPPAPETLCRITDPRITELSGLVSDGAHWYGINDGGTKVEVFVFGRNCAVQKVITNSLDPYDVEDLARAADGTLWLSDTGDNRKSRKTIALLAMTTQGKTTLHRLSYPDGPHDTEALILDPSGTPYLITKEILGDAQVYRPAGALASPGPTALVKVGSLAFKTTDTPGGPVGEFGSVLVTGGASSADGKVIALRTYTDAYLYSAPDGDVVAALKRVPVRVPLPDEKQGEALAFEPDGTLLSGGEAVGQPIRAIRAATSLVQPAVTNTGADTEKSGGTGAVAAPQTAATAATADGFDLPVVLGIAVALVVAIVGWYAFSRVRRRR